MRRVETGEPGPVIAYELGRYDHYLFAYDHGGDAGGVLAGVAA